MLLNALDDLIPDRIAEGFHFRMNLLRLALKEADFISFLRIDFEDLLAEIFEDFVGRDDCELFRQGSPAFLEPVDFFILLAAPLLCGFQGRESFACEGKALAANADVITDLSILQSHAADRGHLKAPAISPR